MIITWSFAKTGVVQKAIELPPRSPPKRVLESPYVRVPGLLALCYDRPLIGVPLVVSCCNVLHHVTGHERQSKSKSKSKSKGKKKARQQEEHEDSDDNDPVGFGERLVPVVLFGLAVPSNEVEVQHGTVACVPLT